MYLLFESLNEELKHWPHSNSQTGEPSNPVISPTTFHLKPTPGTYFSGLFKFFHEFPVGKSTNFLYPSK